MTSRAYFAGLTLLAAVSAQHAAHAAEPPADTVYRNGYIYTVDAKDSVREALAVRAGRIVYVGDNAGVQPLTGKATKVIDLKGRMLMPGLVDGHMHPQSGGSRLLNCSLDYQALTVAQFQSRIQACIDNDKRSGKPSGPDRWLVCLLYTSPSPRDRG